MTDGLDDGVVMVETTRGGRTECVHRGHAVVVDAGGDIVEAWGDPALVTYPRSSAKMIQALPLVESGAADAHGLTPRQLSLACASHEAAAIHVDAVNDWIATLGLSDDDFRCGAQEPRNKAVRDAMIRAGDSPCQVHNNCSGKHAGFLTLNRHLGGGPDYEKVGHPVQQAARAAWEEVTGETSPGYGIDGCSAPNFATSMTGMARAMAAFAAAAGGHGGRSGTRTEAQARLVEAMIAHPEMVYGEGRACTEMMRAAGGAAAVKGGADGFYAAILPERGLGVAVKLADGGDRAKDIAMGAILARLGVLPEAARPRFVDRALTNWRGVEVGRLRATGALA
ncbi:asparaginase [Wenxinia saemankumensis]|uniref:Asparaginase n=1 Tax=Wenxinia saemankumensis TaxID=1447782 RepID=A0A1M6FXE2_9RHOB|nr:asparaginase [Wenxinia saemankumensis]SHJ02381.1 asparaginase [Wenxinia saemankumensis]